MSARGRIADAGELMKVPEAPCPDGGPAPHYASGGRAARAAAMLCEGGKAGRRLDRGGRKRGGHITAAQRHALPASDFALSGEHYPIDTEGRARSALSRASANASPAEQATIRRKVQAKYPGMKVS
jgi:hypothetical protein